ncbi:MAG: ABC transporter substrate-binding protein [Betaproteobacteria bacterium]|nr:ABC transporter substrate-binding protein [Betaproteobacteria bacterium]
MRQFRLHKCFLAALTVAFCSIASGALAADAQEIHVSRQFGLPYIPLVIIERKGLLEKHLKSLGLGDVKVSWSTLGTGSATQDGLLSGSTDFASAGIALVLQLWDKTQGTANEIKAISSIASFPYPLVTNNPNVKTLKDFGPNDRIAVPAIKISVQAIVLQMAAAKEFGADKRTILDPQTVSLSHPDAAIAVMSKRSEITAHFSYPPYSLQELKTPGVHVVFWANDITNGPASTIEVVTSSRVLKEHPKWVEAWLAAQDEANAFIAGNKREAAQLYLDATKEKISVDELVSILSDPQARISTTPFNTMVFANYMKESGAIKKTPVSWKDYFFPIAYKLQGS